MVSSIDDLVTRTTIDFPRPIREREVRKMLQYVASNLGAETNIGYNVSTHEAIIPEIIEDKPTGGHVSDNNGSQKIDGSIVVYNLESDSGRMASGQFSLSRKPSTENYRSYDGLKFSTIPGYDLDEINPNELVLFDRTRKYVADWFTKVSEDDSKTIRRISRR